MKNIMDNQQVNLIVAKAWIAGMLDADGCISYTFSESKKGYKVYRPLIDIVSVCTGTMSALTKTFELLEIPFWFYNATAKRNTMAIRVAGVKRAVKFLEIITPFLVTKKEEAENMLEYCKSRLSTNDGRKPYSEDEIKLLQNIKRIKAIRSLRDYNPDVLWLQGEDIVRTADESGREEQK